MRKSERDPKHFYPVGENHNQANNSPLGVIQKYQGERYNNVHFLKALKLGKFTRVYTINYGG